jgi:hypothetical protein
MATVYLIDNDLDAVLIERVKDSAMARARGMLFVQDKEHNQNKLEEMYLTEEKAYWLRFEGSNKYCLVK